MCSRLFKGMILLAALGMALAVGVVLGGTAVYLVSQDNHPRSVVEITTGTRWQGFPSALPHRIPVPIWGAPVLDVEPDTPASRAGLQEGDVIAALDGEPVLGPGSLIAMIVAREPGDEVELTLYRLAGQARRSIVVTLGKHPEHDQVAYLGVWLDGELVDLDSEFWRE